MSADVAGCGDTFTTFENDCPACPHAAGDIAGFIFAGIDQDQVDFGGNGKDKLGNISGFIPGGYDDAEIIQIHFAVLSIHLSSYAADLNKG